MTFSTNKTPRRPALRGAIALLPLLAGLLMFAAAASAGPWVQVLCRNPDGSSSSSQGVTTFTEGTPRNGSGASASCDATHPLFAAIGAAGVSESVGTNEVVQAQPPAGSTLIGGVVNLVMYADGAGLGASGTAIAFTPTHDGPGVFFQCSSGQPACGSGGTPYDFGGTLELPANRGGNLYFSAGCGGMPGQSCTEHADLLGPFDVYALLEVNWADLRLSNTSTPAASNITGTLLTPGARGTQDVALTAADPGGPGVYNVTVQLDTSTLYNSTPDTNGGQCVPVGASSGALMFDYAQPCKASENADIPINTTAVIDGQHTLKVIVRDAAGNQSTVYDNAISTHNAPVNTSVPVIVAPTQILTGTPLTSQAGGWSAPAGTGSITYTYQWQDCDASGQGCHAIVGAEGAAYIPTQTDVGHTLRLQVTAANTDGFTPATTAATNAVAAPQGSSGAPEGSGTGAGSGGTNGSSGANGSNGSSGANGAPGGTGSTGASGSPGSTPAGIGAPNGTVASGVASIQVGVARVITRAYAHSALGLPGRLVDGQGQPISGASLDVLQQTVGSGHTQLIARARTSGDGTFLASLPAGSSRLITIAYRAYTADPVYAAQASVLESVGAGVQLHVAPLKTSSRGTITLRGRAFGPIPAHGVIVQLLGRRIGEPWKLFGAPRTDRRGTFHATYRFRGTVGRFQLKAQIRGGQAGFPYAAGLSVPVNVRTF